MNKSCRWLFGSWLVNVKMSCFSSKDTCQPLFRSGYIASPRRPINLTYFVQVISLIVGPGIKNSQETPNLTIIRISYNVEDKLSIAWWLKWPQGKRVKHQLWTGRSRWDQLTHNNYLTSTPVITCIFPHDHPSPSQTRSRFSYNTIPPRRV